MAKNIEALCVWDKLDNKTQFELLENVFCRKCGVTTIVDYDITLSKPDIILKGKCKKCNGNVARLIESDWLN